MKVDKQIWDDFRRGEDYALSRIYFQYTPFLFRYGRKFSLDEEMIKDVIQDLFLYLISARESLGTTDNIRFYLIASFRRRLSNVKKQKAPLSYSDREVLTAEIIYSAEHELIEKEELSHREQTVKAALAKLSPRQREILFYRFSCNFDYDQICEIMQIQYDSARKQVFRALKGLKEILISSDMFVLFFVFFQKDTIVY